MKQKKENNFPLMARYLKGNIRYFAAAILCSVLSTVCNSLTPQIISDLIEKIVVGERQKVNDKWEQQFDIYYRFVGLI